MNKYFNQLKRAQSDEIAPGLKGELVRLANLATQGITSWQERCAIASLLLKKATDLEIDCANLRATAAGIATRGDNPRKAGRKPTDTPAPGTLYSRKSRAKNKQPCSTINY